MAEDKAQSVNASLYPDDLELVSDFAKKRKQNFSEALRFIIRSFFKQYEKQMKADVFLFLVYPAVLCIIMLWGAITTENMMDILILKEFYFDELYILNRTFNIMGFGTLSWFIANMYILYRKRHANKNFEED